MVLPFAALSADPETELFADGLSEEVITDLSRIASLRVISRVSARQLKETTKDVRTIGRELDVGFAVSGSVRRAGANLRVSAQLVEVGTEAEIWADRFDATIEQLFDVQERLSRQIVAALKARLTPAESEQLAVRPIANVQAYECFLKARAEVLTFSEDGALRAARTAERGLQIVGDNALLYGVLGHAHAFHASVLTGDQEPALAEAERCAARVAELDPASGYADFVRGFVHFLRGDMQSAVRHMKAALILEPRNPDVLFWLTEAYVVSGRCDAARPLARELAAVDPLTPTSRSMGGFVELMDCKPAAALAPYREMYADGEGHPYVRWAYAIIIAWNGLVDEAREVLGRFITDTPTSFWAMLARFMKPALEGDRETALKAATPELLAATNHSVFWSWLVAQMYALVDERNAALDLLENAVNKGFINYPLLVHGDPLIRNVRGEPRFAQLLDRVRPRWEAFEA